VRRLLLALALALLLVGCGGGEDAVTETETTTVTETTTTEPTETIDVRVYWLRDGKVWPALREVDEDGAEAAALDALLGGPTEQERLELDFSTAIPDGTESTDLEVDGGVARVTLTGDLPEEPLAQLVYTLTQFAPDQSVEVTTDAGTRSFDRGDFEDLTPAILVESPLSFEEVESPLEATGTANTFEADFQYELTDTDGIIIAENFVRATSGTGTRGTFAFTVPFEVNFDGVGSLIVFESSANDGSRINLVEIPVRMKR
jgi:germination protein M